MDQGVEMGGIDSKKIVIKQIKAYREMEKSVRLIDLVKMMEQMTEVEVIPHEQGCLCNLCSYKDIPDLSVAGKPKTG